MSINQLAEKLLIAMYSNPSIEPEDYVHNAAVAKAAAVHFVGKTCDEGSNWSEELRKAVNAATAS